MPKEWLSEIIHLFRHVKEERPSISNFRMSNVEGFDVSAVSINNGCGPIECTSTPILELGEGSLAMLIVGCVHGDEISGPPVVYHLVKLLVGLLEDEIGKELLKSRRIVLLPFANVWGYMNQKRHDLTGSDPNRDFPYHEENCLKTITANQVSQALVPDDIQLRLKVRKPKNHYEDDQCISLFIKYLMMIQTHHTPNMSFMTRSVFMKSLLYCIQG